MLDEFWTSCMAILLFPTTKTTRFAEIPVDMVGLSRLSRDVVLTSLLHAPPSRRRFLRYSSRSSLTCNMALFRVFAGLLIF